MGFALRPTLNEEARRGGPHVAVGAGNPYNRALPRSLERRELPRGEAEDSREPEKGSRMPTRSVPGVAWALVTLCSVMGIGIGFDVATAHTADPRADFFERSVRPLLIDKCIDCHSEESGLRRGGLLLDRREGWEIGGESGPAIVPGNPDASLILTAVKRTDATLQMP